MLYNPISLTLLLESKYATTRLITITDLLTPENSCLAETLDKQLSSYVRITRSVCCDSR